jgi:hypothetical protein
MHRNRFFLGTCATLMLLVAAQVFARGVRIDFEDANFEFTGQAWETLQFVDVAAPLQSSGAISLGFSIDFGLGLVDTLYINENGFVSFGSAVDFVGGLASLADLGANVVAPFYDNLDSVTGSGDFFTDGSVSYSRGRLDTTPPFDDPTTAPLALRVTWYNVTNSNGDELLFQALFLQGPSAGDFDLELNYGSGLDLPAVPQLAGFVLGSNVFSLTSGFGSGFDYTFRFRGGVLDGSTEPPPVAVPEPGSLTLLSAGLLLLAFRILRRRVILPRCARVRRG